MTITGNDGTDLGGLGFSEFTGNTNQAATRESFDLVNGTVSAIREFIGPWANRFDFIDSYLLVEQNEYPDRRVAKISKIDIKGEGTSSHNSVTNMAQFDRAHLVVNYATIIARPLGQRSDQSPEDFSNRRFVEEAIDANIEVLQIEGSEWRTVVGQTSIGEDFKKLSIIVPIKTIIIKLLHVFKPFWIEISLAEGKLNDTAFITPSGIAMSAGSVRYDGITGSTKIDVDTLKGEDDFPFPVWEITHQFSYNFHDWNFKYFEGEFREIENIENSDKLYESFDLYSIFFGAGNTSYDRSVLSSINILIIAIENAIKVNINNIHSNAVKIQIKQLLALERRLGFNV